MRRLTPEEELDILVMTKRPEYACDVLLALNSHFEHRPECKVFQLLKLLWQDREILKQQLKDERS